MGAWEAAYFMPQRVKCVGSLPGGLLPAVEGEGLSVAACPGSQRHGLEGGLEVSWGGLRGQVWFRSHCGPGLFSLNSVLGGPAWCQVLAGQGWACGASWPGFRGRRATKS